MPVLPHPIGIKVYGLDSALLEGATVTLTLGTESIDDTTNQQGEVILDTANLPSGWSVGDSVTIKASKTEEGEASTTLVLTSDPQQTTLTLAQTSDLIWHDDGTNQFVLNFALIVDQEGNKITDANPLPVSSSPPPKDVRFDSDDSAPDYVGLNYDNYNADTDTRDWVIYKFTYSSGNVTRVQKRTDVSWDDRTSLF